MTIAELQEKLTEAVKDNSITDEVLEVSSSSFPSSPSSALSAIADSSAASSSSSLVARCLQELADSTQRVKRSSPFAAVFSYDGGLELSVYGSWSTLPSDNFLIDVLKTYKQKAVDSNTAVPVVVGDCAFWLLPHGARSGYGSYSYQLIMQEDNRNKYVFLLHTSPCPSIAGVRVKCEYQAFRNGRTLAHVRDDLTHILSVIGFHVDRYCISRIDFNLTVNHSIQYLNTACNEDRITNRCREFNTAGGRSMFKSFRAGDINSIQVAVYDKSKELLDHYDYDKVCDLASSLGSPVGQDWTRYEFRLGRKFLHSLEIDTFDDYISSELAIVNYLTLYWFNIRLRKSKTGKTVNYRLDYFWREVRFSLLFAVLTGNFCVCEDLLNTYRKDKSNNDLLNIIGRWRFLKSLPVIRRNHHRKFRTTAKRLVKLSLGCIISALAMSSPSGVPLDHDSFNKSVLRTVSFYSDEAFSSYIDRFSVIQGDIKRNYQEGYIDNPSLLGGLRDA